MITRPRLRNAAIRFAEQGFPLVAFIARDDLPEELDRDLCGVDDLEPERYPSLLLTASAGPRFWRLAVTRYPEPESDPVDRHARQTTEEITQRQLGLKSCRRLYPGDIPLPLQRLGNWVGWHHPSPLGITIHPRYGLWTAFRSLYGLSEALPTTVFPETSNPCADCQEKYCVTGCPAGAVRDGQPFALKVCGAYRSRPDSPCAVSCPARLSCPVGESYRYAEPQMRFHYARSLACLGDAE